jgi:hypothetical protein
MAMQPLINQADAAAGRTNSGLYGAPVMDSGMTFREVGQTGLRQYSGWVREEFLPQLLGRQAARVYREMQDNNATIGAMLFAITQTMRKIEWRVKPANATPAALAEAQFADSLRFDMSGTWEDFIAEALSMLAYGYSVHEIVYKRRLGAKPLGGRAEDGTEIASSLFNDGRIGIRKLPIRGQDTVIKWFFGPNGSIEGVTQQPYTGGIANIPIEKCLLFRPTAHKNNPEGRSILRNSYRSWYVLKRFEEEEAIFYERMSGVPCMFVPQELMEAAAAGDQNAQAQVNAYKRMVTNTKIGEQMGLLLPSNTWPAASGAQGATRMYEFQLITPQGRSAAVDSDKVITRHRLDMLMSVLADFITLGHASHGTQSLAETKVDMFFQGIEGWCNSIAGVLNRYLLPRIWELNNLDPTLMPEFQPDLAQRIDLLALSDFVLKLAQSGMQMFPDTDLENYLRDAGGLPATTDAAYAVNQGVSGDDILDIPALKAPGVTQRTAKPAGAGPGNVTRPSIEATATGQVATLAAVNKMLLAAHERRVRLHTQP